MHNRINQNEHMMEHRTKIKREYAVTGILFVAPILTLMAIWFYYPIGRSFYFSLHELSFLRPDDLAFVGFSNYRELIRNPRFLLSLKNSLVLTMVGVPVQSACALLLAVGLRRIQRGKGFFRTLIFQPYITSTVAVTTVFMYFFLENSGIATQFLASLGFRNVSWFADVQYALPFLIILCVWTYTGFYMVIYLNGLLAIPESLYEQAHVEGASSLQQFFAITLPLLRPTTFLVMTSGMIFLMQIFDQPFTLSRGGILGSPAGATSTVVIYFYNQAFRFNKAGLGSAAAFIIFFVILVLTLAQKKISELLSHEEA
jgi:multiple sugar transport system permease protein